MAGLADGVAAAEERKVAWALGPTTVDGTFLRPAGAGPFAGAVFVAGSGPTDRDWNSPLLPGTNGSGRLVAEALARAGIASLRYDKRGVGPHAQGNLEALRGRVSMESHREEVAGAVAFLAGQGDVRSDRLFAVTNSEGALHALHYQLSGPAVPLAGLVLTAPPGRAVGAVARTQLAEQAAAVPNGDKLLALYDAAIGRFLAGAPVDPDPALPPGVKGLLKSLSSPLNLPFSRELWQADAAELLARLSVPVLVLIGKRDIQVDWRLDGDPLRRAATGGTDATFRFPEHANHLLKYEASERSALTAADVGARYNAADAALDPEAETEIRQWLLAHI